jgi:phthalate 4,5-cis-dihydrodiol dehydrogenase
MGGLKNAGDYGATRRSLVDAPDRGKELALKNARNYGGAAYIERAAGAPAAAPWHQHFGLVLVCCEHGDLRPLPNGVMIYGNERQHLEPLQRPNVARIEVIDELYGAIVQGHAPLHDGRWARATLEVCLAMLQSARERRDIVLAHQVGLPS